MEAQIYEHVQKFLTLAFVPRNTQWSYYSLDGCEIITIRVLNIIAGTMKEAISLGKAEDIEIVNPLDCWRDVMILPDVNGSISYLTLETCGGGESKWDIMIHVKPVVVEYNEVVLVIWFDQNCAIGIFYIQCSHLSSRGSSSHLREMFVRLCGHD